MNFAAHPGAGQFWLGRVGHRVLYQSPVAVAAATTADENVACRLGDVRIGRAHLATPPWVPGFPGKSM